MLKASALCAAENKNPGALIPAPVAGRGYGKSDGSERLVFVVKTQYLHMEEYLETAIRNKVDNILADLAEKYKKEYHIFTNVRIAGKHGTVQKVFDFAFEFDGIFYVIVVKSAENANGFEKYHRIGKKYQINPQRLLLMDGAVSEEYAEIVDDFCDYYVTNFTENGLRKQIAKMIENDQN